MSGLPTSWFIVLLVVGFVAGIRICQSATDAIGMPDHGAIVWDEVIGFGVTMIAAPAGWEVGAGGFRAVSPVRRAPSPMAHLLVRSPHSRRAWHHAGRSSPACLPWPACNCLPTGEGFAAPERPSVVFSLISSCKEVGYTIEQHAALRGLRFCMQSLPACSCRRAWAQVDPFDCPYLALPIFPYSRYAAVKKSFHINIHYSFEAGQHNADSGIRWFVAILLKHKWLMVSALPA